VMRRPNVGVVPRLILLRCGRTDHNPELRHEPVLSEARLLPGGAMASLVADRPGLNAHAAPRQRPLQSGNASTFTNPSFGVHLAYSTISANPLERVMVQIAALILIFASSAQAFDAPRIDPAAVERRIATHGAKTVVDELSYKGRWARIEARIAHASRVWLRLVPALAEGTDAGASEGLGQSLVEALPKAPAAVLAVVDPTGRSRPRSPGVVCGANFYEGDSTDVPHYRARAIAAVSRVRDPRLTAVRDLCLVQLRSSDR
jgi:hypothetical protein